MGIPGNFSSSHGHIRTLRALILSGQMTVFNLEKCSCLLLEFPALSSVSYRNEGVKVSFSKMDARFCMYIPVSEMEKLVDRSLNIAVIMLSNSLLLPLEV